MIDERSKISMKLLAQKSETSNKSKISRPLCKSGSNYNKTKMEVSTSKIVSARSLPPDPVRKNGNNYEHQSKLKCTNVVPRNPSKDTSDGVQEFIKHVSQYIEKKTPFKGTTGCSFADGGNTETPKFDSIQFNGMARKLNERKKVEGSTLEKSHLNVEDKNKKTLMKKKNHPVKLNSVCPVKKDSIGAKGKVNSSTKKTEEVNKKLKKGQPENKKTQSQPVKKVTADSSLHPENEGCFLKKSPPSRGRASDGPVQNKIKRRRPSEIPLRKDRRDSYKKPKFVSLLLQKPLKQVESAMSVGFESTSKSFLPMEELCSEVQMTISVNFSSQKINIEGEKIDISGVEDEEMQESIRLDRCCKSPNIPDVINASTNYSLEEKPSTSKKANVIDLDKVKTSSFTVLRTSSTVLDRLESLHKQNVLSKEKSVSKSKILMAKASSKTFKENPKKISHLSSKGNKSGLKVKVKKRKETSQERGAWRKLKKRPKSNTETSRIKETSKTGKTPGQIPRVERSPRESRLENATNEKFKANVKNRKKEESKMHKTKLSIEKSAFRATPRDEEFKSSDPVISGVEYFESQILEKSKSVTNFNSSKFPRNLSKQCLNISKSSEKTEMHDLEENIQNQETPTTPPPTPENECPNDNFTKVGQIVCEGWSSKTVSFEPKFTGENYCWCSVLQETETVVPEIVTKQDKENEEMTEQSGSFGKGTLLNFCKGEPSEISEEPEPPSVKRQLRIDLNTHEVSTDDERVEENEENQLIDPAPTEAKCRKGLNHDKDISNATEKGGSEEGKCKSQNVSGDALSSEVMEETGSFSQTIQKPRKSCSSLKRKQQCKSGGSVKGIRKKKIRSDAGDRPSPSASIHFNSDPALQNKTKTDSKARSGLTKSAKWEEKSDVFEDAAAIKLKRRNSEPNSFRGYVWKCADAATPRGHKTSVSSMTSSLRHLNTDEIDDFIFWEAVPQKMTSCWEMSLYHFKRPWSVLSCSVFRDNRMSSTPGLILENLRSGGTLNTRRSTLNQSERVTCRRENPFDVEPSIAQKNIDIRNWLAALNFPTFPSTSTDGLSEGNFTTQFSVDSQNPSKVSQKRRKVLPNLKFADEVSKKKVEGKEKHKRSSKWDSCDEEGLTELIRKKSGGFVTKEQYLNSEHSVHRPNVTVNFCVYSKSAEESILVETSDRNSVCEPRKYKSVEVAIQPEVSISATIINSGAIVGDQLVEKIKAKEKPKEVGKEVQVESGFGQFLKRDLNYLRSDVNIWKYLFILTLFIIVTYYCFLNNHMGHN